MARRTAIEKLSATLAVHRMEEERLRSIIERTPSSTERMLSSIDLVKVLKKISAVNEQMRQPQA